MGRCPNGTRKKRNDCIRISQIRKDRRCENGTRRNRKTRECEIKTEIKRMRCPNGSRKNVRRECIKRKTFKIPSVERLPSGERPVSQDFGTSSLVQKNQTRKSPVSLSSLSLSSLSFPTRQTRVSQRTPIDFNEPIDFERSTLSESSKKSPASSLKKSPASSLKKSPASSLKKSSASSLKKSSSSKELKSSMSFSNDGSSKSDDDSSDKNKKIILKPTVVTMKNPPTENTKRANDKFIMNRLKKNKENKEK